MSHTLTSAAHKWFAISDQDVQALPDPELANLFTEAVKLVQATIVAARAHRESIYIDPFQVGALYDRLEGEIVARGKHWSPLVFGGGALLEPGVAELRCGLFLPAGIEARQSGMKYRNRLCQNTPAGYDPASRRVRCPEHLPQT